MAVTLNPYLSFRGEARAAIEFYQSVFGGEVDLSTFAEAGMPVGPSEGDQIMHARLAASNGLVLMASDVPSEMPGDYANGQISLSGPEEDEAVLTEYWNKLSEGGTVTAEFARAPWGDLFGMCVDKFGVNWLIDVVAPQQQ